MIGNPDKSRRRGIALALALGALAVMIVMVVAIVGIGRQARRGGAADERRLHTAWLLQAGAERASARLRSDPSYAGETWTIAPGRLGVPDPAQVAISVTPNPDRPSSRIAQIVARLAPGTLNQARLSHNYTIDAGTPARLRPEGDSD